MHACAGKYPVQVTSVSRLSNPVAIVTWAYLCIDIPGGTFVSGARIQQYKCNGTAPAQKFNITQFLGESAWNRSDGPVYRIQTAADQLCWTVPADMTLQKVYISNSELAECPATETTEPSYFNSCLQLDCYMMCESTRGVGVWHRCVSL